VTTSKRQCYYIPEHQFDDQGWIPSLVTEGEPGHRPFTGGGSFAQPWHWGLTLEQARAMAERMNREDFGLSPAGANAIVLSSMGAGRP
jgi:hypothetical protein